MKNYWSYELEFTADFAFSPDKFSAVLDIFRAAGFKEVNPEAGLVTGIYNDEPFESDDPAKVAALLGTEGGIIDLWFFETNISLFFNKEQIPNQLAIIVNDTVFDKVGIAFSDNLKAIFSRLCEHLQPLFGFSRDEETSGRIFYEDVINHLGLTFRPELLYWINYFSADFLESLGGKEIFNPFPCKITELATGYLIYFSDYPWELTADKLQKINDKWQVIKMSA